MAKGPTVSTTFNAKDKITGPMKKMKGNMKKFALAGGAAIAAASVMTLKAVNNFANAGDEIAKSARKINISVEALQELRFAADRSGVSSEAFTTALQKLNKNVGDLRAGTGMLRTMLDKTNPAMAEQLKNAENNEEAFNILVKALSETENEMDRAALAQAAFGRAGQDLLIMTENGTEGIAQLREEARKYGNVISTEAAAASELYVDSLTNMKASMMALRNKALIPLMQKLQPFIQMIADYVSENQKLINQKVEDTFKAIGKTIKTLVKLWDNGLIPALLAGATAWMAITKAIAAYKAILIFAKAAQIAFNVAVTANPIGLIIAAIVALVAAIVWMIFNWDKVLPVLQKVWDKMKAFGNWVKDGFVGAFNFAMEQILAIWEVIRPIVEAITGAAKAAVSFVRGDSGPNNTGNITGGYGRLLGANDAALAGAGTNSSSQLSVNFNNAPAGTEFRQKGSAPGITVDTGHGGRL